MAAQRNKKQPVDTEPGQLVLDSTIPYQINRLSHHMNRLLDQELKMHGLSISYWRVMAVLDYNSAVSVNHLADYAMIEQSTLSRQLQRMENEGILENRRSNNDGRARNIVLTRKGRRKYEEVREMTMQHVARITGGFKPEEQALLLKLVQRMQANTVGASIDFKSP